ncbi:MULTISPECIES: glutaredoxin family protein [Bacillaceae]|uniref:NrdH-redoxin n=1 Tax=Domibacillus aminovorans TaxID=29332 RepID=A0A177KP68_9BACI|nr:MULTISPECIES: glutaredoxin family protein [Bacillaceae]OAH54685.1 NrdH-redoxin [Domibacillus aminovorans]OAH61598.1 NrdH-redoxin [Domibacillus aminovorans]
MDVYFYTRPDCHLCEEAKVVMHMVKDEIDITLYERNIDECDKWTEQYGLMIPVVECDGEMIQYGRVDYFTIFTKLKQNLNKQLKK